MNRRLFLRGLAGAAAGLVAVPALVAPVRRYWALDGTMAAPAPAWEWEHVGGAFVLPVTWMPDYADDAKGGIFANGGLVLHPNQIVDLSDVLLDGKPYRFPRCGALTAEAVGQAYERWLSA